MGNNIFEELQLRKQKLIQLTEKAAEFGWIDDVRKKEILDKIAKDVLTIGVIGQMKCGKSTFLNAFVFGKDILPAATTPMTAALSVITYGEKERIVAEFYTADEWEEQKMQAQRNLDDVAGNAIEESKVKAAKELVAKADKLGGSISKYLGTTQEDSFNNLVEYVGADGKYISITKAVTIYYPKDYLKGVEIVDTPGFNDPIVSREERTKAFLNKADVVLMMLYAGRPFDATDREILMKNVRQSGIGKVLIGINKYDIPSENGETEEEIRNYVKEEIRKACKACDDDGLVEIIRQTEPIPLSAQMALLATIPMKEISSSDEYHTAWKRLCGVFEIGSQPEMYTKSHMKQLTDAVQVMIENEKANILFVKPVNAILAAGNTIRQKYEAEINQAKSRLEALNLPDDELEEREDQLNKALRRMDKKLEGFGDSIDSELRDVVRTGTRDLEDVVDSTCDRMRSIVENDYGLFTKAETVTTKLSAEIDKMQTRTLKRACDEISRKAEKKVKSCVNDFMDEAEEVLRRFVQQVDSRDFVNKIKQQVILEITNKDLFTAEDVDGDGEIGFIDVVAGFFNGATFGLLRTGIGMLTHGDEKREMLATINNISSQFDPSPYLKSVFANKDALIEQVKKAFIDELITPMQEQIEEIRAKKTSKVKDIADTTAKLNELQVMNQKINSQIEEVTTLKNNIVNR